MREDPNTVALPAMTARQKRILARLNELYPHRSFDRNRALARVLDRRVDNGAWTRTDLLELVAPVQRGRKPADHSVVEFILQLREEGV